MNNEVNVLIVQNLIPLYRVPFFNGLSRVFNKQLTVVHTKGSVDVDCEYSENRVSDIQIGKLHYTPGLYRELKNADVIVVMFDLRWLSLMLWSLIFRKKVLLWGHGYGKHRLSKFIRKIFIRLTAAILVYEEDAAKQIMDDGIKSEKIFFTGNTVYVSNHGVSNHLKRTQYIYVGRLQERKELMDIIYAFNLIKDNLPNDIGVTFLGDGSNRQELEYKVQQFGLTDRISFYGAVYDEEQLKHYYAQAIAYLSPGHVGLGVLHSFAYGVPVVTRSDRSHAPEVENIIHNETGMFYEGGPEVLSSVMLSLLNDNKARRLGLAAYRHYTESRSMDMMVKRTVNAIKYVYGLNQ